MDSQGKRRRLVGRPVQGLVRCGTACAEAAVLLNASGRNDREPTPCSSPQGERAPQSSFEKKACGGLSLKQGFLRSPKSELRTSNL
ncbi:hypothetical protein L1887_54145 [Cichorium endivia]|nr:hypothetical protein L1887_54145 [Cichorium endivia]